MIAEGVEIEHPLRMLKDEPLFQPFAAFVKAMAEIAHAQPSVCMHIPERFADAADQLPDFLPVRLRQSAQHLQECRIEIGLTARLRYFR